MTQADAKKGNFSIETLANGIARLYKKRIRGTLLEDFLFLPFTLLDLLIRIIHFFAQYTVMPVFFFFFPQLKRDLRLGYKVLGLLDKDPQLAQKQKGYLMYFLRVYLGVQLIYSTLDVYFKLNMQVMYNALQLHQLALFNSSIHIFIVLIIVNDLIIRGVFLRPAKKELWNSSFTPISRNLFDKAFKTNKKIDSQGQPYYIVFGKYLDDLIDFVYISTIQIFYTTFNLTVNLTLLGLINPQLILYTFGYAFCLGLFFLPVQKTFLRLMRTNNTDNDTQRLLSQKLGEKKEQLTAYARNQGVEDLLSNALENANSKRSRSYRWKTLAKSFMAATARVLGQLMPPLMAIVLGYYFFNGQIGLGALMLSIKLGNDILRDLMLFIKNTEMYTRFHDAHHRLNTQFEQLNMIDQKGDLSLKAIATAVVKESTAQDDAPEPLKFSYNIEIPKNSFIKVDAGNGVGKTTLFKIIQDSPEVCPLDEKNPKMITNADSPNILSVYGTFKYSDCTETPSEQSSSQLIFHNAFNSNRMIQVSSDFFFDSPLGGMEEAHPFLKDQKDYCKHDVLWDLLASHKLHIESILQNSFKHPDEWTQTNQSQFELQNRLHDYLFNKMVNEFKLCSENRWNGDKNNMGLIEHRNMSGGQKAGLLLFTALFIIEEKKSMDNSIELLLMDESLSAVDKDKKQLLLRSAQKAKVALMHISHESPLENALYTHIIQSTPSDGTSNFSIKKVTDEMLVTDAIELLNHSLFMSPSTPPEESTRLMNDRKALLQQKLRINQ